MVRTYYSRMVPWSPAKKFQATAPGDAHFYEAPRHYGLKFPVPCGIRGILITAPQVVLRSPILSAATISANTRNDCVSIFAYTAPMPNVVVKHFWHSRHHRDLGNHWQRAVSARRAWCRYLREKSPKTKRRGSIEPQGDTENFCLPNSNKCLVDTNRRPGFSRLIIEGVLQTLTSERRLSLFHLLKPTAASDLDR